MFPTTKLKAINEEDPRQPLVVVACGSFSPVTFLHMRMFGKFHCSFDCLEMAKDYIDSSNKFQLLGGYFSPVSVNLELKESSFPLYLS